MSYKPVKCNWPISITNGKSGYISFYCVKKHYHEGDHKWKIRVGSPCAGGNDNIIEVLESEIKLLPQASWRCTTMLNVYNRPSTTRKSYFNCILEQNHKEKHKWVIMLNKPDPDKDGKLKGIVVDENNIKKLKSK